MNNLTPTTLGINEVIPYWRNPRNATDADIAKIMSSIAEYGYVNWLIVDTENVIITGHTRYLALRRLGLEQIQVYVSDIDAHSAKEYRVIDNRSAEYTEWDKAKLITEFEAGGNSALLTAFFPELDLDTGEVDLGLGAVPRPEPSERDWSFLTVTCTGCFHEFKLDDAEEVQP